MAILSANSLTILEKRYLDKGETPSDLWSRVSGGNPDYRDLMANLLFLPNSPTLFNMGKSYGGTLSACFVFDIQDCLLGDWPIGGLNSPFADSILGTTFKAACVAKAGGGVGYYLGNIRAEGALVNSTHRKACGPVGVLKWLHNLRSLITQGGKRDLAQMGVLNADHPDILKFIHCKDEDPKALESFNISVSWRDEMLKHVDFNGPHPLAGEPGRLNDHPDTLLWWEQCKSAWRTGDPGMLFWDTINKHNNTPHLGNINATNPCLVADTKVYVADGRGNVTIGELAAKGQDVPVFCLDNVGSPTIRMMRRPRLTGSKVPVYKVTLDNGESIMTTGNHKFRLRKKPGKSAVDIQVKDLKPGDSLMIVTRHIPESCTGDSMYDQYIGISTGSKSLQEHKVVAEWATGREAIPGEDVHHKDENKFNNSPGNLTYLKETDHHSDHSTGLGNGNAYEATNEEIVIAGRNLCKSLGRRFSVNEWRVFGPPINMPGDFSAWRIKTLGTVRAFSNLCAELEGVAEHAGVNPKIVRKYQEALESGLDADIVGNKVIITRSCEHCRGEFRRVFSNREVAYCSVSCSNSCRDMQKATASLKETIKRKQDVIRDDQLTVYHDLMKLLGRSPQKAEWIQACKVAGVSTECSRKSSPFRTFGALVEAAAEYNHKVVSVEYVGLQDVYNGTVDEFHNFLVGGWDEGLTPKGRRRFRYLCNRQCGETPNISDEPCNLGSLALRRFIKRNKSGVNGIDWDGLREAVRTATKFMDDILDWNKFPHPDITNMARSTRKLGLGVMGWADTLALLRIPYDCQEAVDLGEEVMRTISEEATLTSEDLVATKGAYPAWEEGQRRWPGRFRKLRNSTRTSIAPTGTISIIAECEPSIEPHFSLERTRTTHEGIKMTERVEDWLGDLGGFIPKTSGEIDLRWHVKHQAAFQKHTCLGVSKTINLPNSATVQDVSDAYRLMWESGCKGGTIYRDGCRSEQVLVSTPKKSVYTVAVEFPGEKETLPVNITTGEEAIKKVSEFLETKATRRKLPKECKSIRHQFKIGGVKGYIHIGEYDDGTPGEVFIRGSKFGSTLAGVLDTWCMTLSNALQHGTPLKTLVELLKGTRFEPSGMTGNPSIPLALSIPDYVVRVLEEKYIKDRAAHELVVGHTGQLCPDCGGPLFNHGKCLTCTAAGCGYSKCG